MSPDPPGPGHPGARPFFLPLVVFSWLGSRLLFFGSLALAVTVTAPGQLAERLSSWDGAHYLRIALEGYADNNLAFFPAFPAAVRLVSDLLPLPPLVVALLLSNGAFLVALALLHRLSERWLGAEAARATVLLTCLNPLSIFFSLPYTESFFLLFSTLSLTWLGRDPIPSVRLAPIAALCAASRPNGVAIVVPILLAYARQRRLGAGLAVALAGLGGWRRWPGSACTCAVTPWPSSMPRRPGVTSRGSTFPASPTGQKI
ncbi:mannosyltransferase family protein [Cyanobium sp. ATX-6F1]|uniref:mannosyltransferase family protein n=1 Tax=Cyanobium sp. ATX-6F1 TaxID=3137388 RepID=UPI0039BE9507